MAAAKAQTRKPDLKGLLTDPQFTSLSPSDKREALARVTGDTRFSSLSDEDLRTFSTRITGTASSSSPSPRASLSYDPADVGPAFRPPAGAKPVSPRTQTDAMIEQFTPDWNTPVNAAKGVGKTLLGIPKAAYALSPVKPVVEGTAEGYKTLTDRNLSWDEKQKQLQDISKREGLDIGKSVSGITAGKALTYDPIAQGYANAKEAAEQGKSIPEIIQRASEGVPVAGPMAQQSREAAEKGNNAEAIAGGATNVSLLASGLPKGSALRPLGAPVRVVTGGVMKVLPRAADTNAAMRSAFPGSSMTNETVAHMRGTAKEMGLSDADFSRNNPEAAGNVDKVVDAAKKNLQTQHNGLVDPVRQQPLKTPDLAPGMREKIASAWDNSDPGMAKRIRDNTTTVGDVDSIRGELNRLYEDTTYSSPEKTALQKWGKQVRNSFYDSLAEAHDI